MSAGAGVEVGAGGIGIGMEEGVETEGAGAGAGGTGMGSETGSETEVGSFDCLEEVAVEFARLLEEEVFLRCLVDKRLFINSGKEK